MTRFRLYLASQRELRAIIRDLRKTLKDAYAEIAEYQYLLLEAERRVKVEELRANDWEARWCDATFDTLKPRLRSETPFVGEVPHCAGRSDAAHARTAMWPTGDGWTCPVCGELDVLLADQRPTS